MFKHISSIHKNECSVYRTNTQIINEVTVHWKYSVIGLKEKEKENEIYELVFQPNGRLIADWVNKEIKIEEIIS